LDWDKKLDHCTKQAIIPALSIENILRALDAILSDVTDDAKTISSDLYFVNACVGPLRFAKMSDGQIEMRYDVGFM
jgi:hypothetical protein